MNVFNLSKRRPTKVIPIYDYLDWGPGEGKVVIVGKQRVFDNPIKKITREESSGFPF
jgi:hypothetical protein